MISKIHKRLYQSYKTMKIYNPEHIEMRMNDLMMEVLVQMKIFQLIHWNEKIVCRNEKNLKIINDCLDDYGKL
jgi:hypothetical protein